MDSEKKTRKVATWFVIDTNNVLHQCKKKSEVSKVIETNGLTKLIHGFEFVPKTEVKTVVTF